MAGTEDRLNRGLLHSTPPCSLSRQQFGELLQDRTFVDFFNVFLSLPIFPQRALYKFDDRDFEFDPPISRRKKAVDRSALVSWLLQERVPYFYQSSLYLDYQLSVRLLETTPHLSHSSYQLDYDDDHRAADNVLLWGAVGNVASLCKFHAYLSGTSGQIVLQFWKDAQQIKYAACLSKQCRPSQNQKDHQKHHHHLVREMQIKYLGKKGSLNQLKNKEMWHVLKDGASILQECEAQLKNSQQMAHNFNISLEELKAVEQTVFSNLQEAMLTILKEYWLQKYLLHCKVLKSKYIIERDSVKVRSKSDLVTLRYLQDVDQALALAQNSLFPDPQMRKARGAIAWNAMFPHVGVDDSFLKSEDDVVTLLDDKRVVVNPLIPEDMDEMLERYFDLCSSESENSVHDVTAIHSESENECEAAPGFGIQSTSSSEGELEELLRQIETATEESYHRRRADQNLKNFNAAMQVHPLDVIVTKPTGGRPKTSPHDLADKANKKKKILPQIQTNMTRKGSSLETIIKGNQSERLPPVDKHLLYSMSEMVTLGQVFSGASLSEPTYQFTNFSAGYFRFDNIIMLAAVASDHIAGGPFERFLSFHNNHKGVCWIRFWYNAQEYLSTKIKDNTDQLCFRRAKMMVMHHLMGGADDEVELMPGLATRLRHHLTMGTGDDLLRQVQDTALQALQQYWSTYVQLDRDTFSSSVAPRDCHSYRLKQSSRKENFAEEKGSNTPVKLPPIALGKSLPKLPAGSHVNNASSFRTGRTLDNSSSSTDTSDNDGNEQSSIMGLKERRMWQALQLAYCLCDLEVEGLLLPPIQLSEIEYNEESYEGSLTLKKLVAVKRRDLEEYSLRCKQLEASRKAQAKKRAQENVEQKTTTEVVVEDDDTPPYARPFQKNGIWVKRPPKPRSFSELLKSAVHIEFFRRFLAHHNAEGGFMFILSVEDMKKSKESKARQRKINQILRKYFLSSKGFGSLDCNADVIQEIPRMEKVPANLLVSAQSCVQRNIEEKWFVSYMATFPESDDDRNDSQNDNGARKWGKGKTRALWTNFVRLVVRFRRGLLDPATSRQFSGFLRQEAANEIEKQKSSGISTYLPGLPVKKVIKNKLVDVTKLAADMAFLGEAEKFRMLCDNAADAAKSGAYRVEDQVLLEIKAKTIIECFIDSELPPKLQINISNDTATIILQNYEQGLVERRLFHSATMAIFPIMGYMWRKFYKIHMAAAFVNVDKVLYSRKQTPAMRPPTPDYSNLDPSKCKKVISHHEDDHPRFLFSIAQGLRVIVPLPRDRNMCAASSTTSQMRKSSMCMPAGDGSSVQLLTHRNSRAGSVLLGSGQGLNSRRKTAVFRASDAGFEVLRHRRDTMKGQPKINGGSSKFLLSESRGNVQPQSESVIHES